MPSVLHQIRRGFGPTISGITLAFPVPIGTPMGYIGIDSAGQEKTFGAANGCAGYKSLSAGGLVLHKGFLSRDTRGFPGLSDLEQLFGFGLETPFFSGTDGSIEPGDDIDVEGNQYVLTSTVTTWPDGTTTNAATLAAGAQAITSATAYGTEITLANGLFAAAISGDFVTHILGSATLTPRTSTNVRIFVQAVAGYRKP
jgi:hypothetical protein